MADFNGSYFFEIHIHIVYDILMLIKELSSCIAVKEFFISQVAKRNEEVKDHIAIFLELWSPFGIGGVYRLLYGCSQSFKSHTYVRFSHERERSVSFFCVNYNNYYRVYKTDMNELMVYVNQERCIKPFFEFAESICKTRENNVCEISEICSQVSLNKDLHIA